MVQTTTFLIWIKSFPDFTPAEQTNLWQEQNLITNLCAIPIIIFTGRSCDKISAKILIPACILFQIIVMTAYCFIKSPKSWGAYVLAIF
jgi:hypothetical protein